MYTLRLAISLTSTVKTMKSESLSQEELAKKTSIDLNHFIFKFLESSKTPMQLSIITDSHVGSLIYNWGEK